MSHPRRPGTGTPAAAAPGPLEDTCASPAGARLLALCGTAALETSRLSIEPLAATHADLLFDDLADPALYRYIGEPPSSVEALRARFERIADPHAANGQLWLNFAMRRKPEGPWVGTLQATVRTDLQAYIAYVVFRREQRRGYAREGCVALLHYLRAAVGVRRVHVEIDARNVASQLVAESLGFVRTRGPYPVAPVHGKPAQDVAYALEVA